MKHKRLAHVVVYSLGIATAVLVALVVVFIAPRTRQARFQAQIVARIRALGGEVKYDYQIQNPNAKPGRLQRLLGDDFFGRVVEVDLRSTRVSDNDLQILHELPSMTWLGLYDTSITDRGLIRIGKMQSTRISMVRLNSRHRCRNPSLGGTLQSSRASYSVYGDYSMPRWPTLPDFPNLRELAVAETAVTDKGVKQLANLAFGIAETRWNTNNG